MKLIFLLTVDEEEGFVFADGSAEGAAKLVQVELFGVVSEVALGIERGVAQELEQAAVKVVVPDLVVTNTVGPARVPNSAE